MAATKKNLSVSLLELNEGQMYGLPKNPRWIRDARFEALKKSIEDAPEMLDLREILVYPMTDVEGHENHFIVIGGNMRLRACIEIGYKEVPCKVLDLETPTQKLREYVIKDNEAFGQNDYDVLADEWSEEELRDWGMELDFYGQNEFGDEDNENEEGGEGDDGDSTRYSTKIESPVYEITGAKPTIAECVNTDAVKRLLATIDASDVPEDEKEMLRVCAYRHAAIRFDNMAEYYAHSSPEMQSLMEANALVIIDFDQAIERGFVEMTDRMREIIGEEGEETDLERADYDEE